MILAYLHAWVAVVPSLAVLLGVLAWRILHDRRGPHMPELSAGTSLFTPADIGCVITIEGRRYRIAHFHSPTKVTLRETTR